MKTKIIMTRNYPSGVFGRPTLYAGHQYTVDDKVAARAIAAGAATKMPEPKKPEPKAEPVKTEDAPKRTYRKAMTGAPENKAEAPKPVTPVKSDAASADKSTLD